MQNFTKLAGLAVFFALTSCSGDDAPAVAANNCATDIDFFHTGNFLDYEISQFGMAAGSMRMTFGECSGAGYITTREVYNAEGTLMSTSYDLLKQEGDFLLSDEGNDGDFFSKLYKKNAIVGDEWQVTRPDGSIIYHEVIATDSIVTVPAGTFECIVYKYTRSDIVNDSYIFWNDQVGNIKEDAGFFVIELQDHNN